MDLVDSPDGPAKLKIAEHYDKFPDLDIRHSEFDEFKSSIVRQPHLKSSYGEGLNEGKSLFDLLCLYYKGSRVGSLSFFLERNEMKKSGADHFGHIDIVVVEADFRGKDVGKLIVLTAVKYMLDRWGTRIYSLRCLAAHEAMAKILEGIGFDGEQRDNETFVRETLSLNEENRGEISSLVNTRVGEVIQVVNYRLL